jgi:type I restriction enzyme S subunit
MTNQALLPTKWETARLKYVARTSAGGTPHVDDPQNWAESEDGFPWVTIADMTSSAKLRQTQRRVSAHGLKSARLHLGDPGTLLFSLYASLGQTAVLETKACWNQAILGLTPRWGTDSRYLSYALEALRPLIQQLARSNTQSNLNAEQVGNLPIPSPPLDRQRTIADFLDRETARIDSLIERKAALRSTLHLRWEQEVESSVTHGIEGGNLKRVSSPWFEAISEHWKLLPLKRRWRVLDCKHRTADYVSEGYPVVSPGDVGASRVFPGRTGRFVSAGDFEELTEGGRRPLRGDLIYTRNASIGAAGFVDTDEPFSMGQDVCLIRSEGQNQRFLMYFLNSVAIRQLEAQKVGVTFDRINVAQILNLQVACPPPAEQHAIAAHLDASTRRYESLGTSIEAQLRLLAERRQALVTAAVTGQVNPAA